MIYAKCYQRDNLYNYYAADLNRHPVGVEVVCFLGTVPHVRYEEYDPNRPGDRIEIDAITNHYDQITRQDYQEVFRRATSADFTTS